MGKLLITLLLSATLTLSGCVVHKIDIQQGNVVSQEMLDKLKPGMSKRQVRYALGTPLITDTFHQDRWDYVYSLSEGGKLKEKRRVSLFFEEEKLSRIEGDMRPSASE
ncbi:hypothetical protein BOW53_02660 [Solemya pervernicosa gill symbiont]|uniref:Outer membrane protein assembly factor BamE n=2 Tax=Gammaproteobacteria incertae sedis TaxID=118884 RepID=A0A1T2L9H4_9GAMM|nr:outer membrane protein assembly factor BamE [Candidatus Reidiella endopervernicosa]OOZ41755.1 hypothetical protein BOW53_02660 [Solemya pervernicosa gill symbiont]QKQ26458.1 outer membrane protein assembly factor BamE [Candidatus Reidiella endopervernicosa]